MEVALTSSGCSVLSSLALCASTDCKPIDSCCSFSHEDVSSLSYKNIATTPHLFQLPLDDLSSLSYKDIAGNRAFTPPSS